jgi:uncharacterized membrane protein YdjX (TVP38/TMEM64 family)
MTLTKHTRLALAAAGITALAGIGIWLVQTGRFSAEQLSTWVSALGCWSAPTFLLSFIIGQLLYVPGALFVGAARVSFGPGWGVLLAYVGALAAITVPFLLARYARGSAQAAYRPRFAFLRRALDRVELRPIQSMVLLRSLLFLSPPLNYALAFTSVRTRDYVVGSALGLLIPTVVVTSSVGWLL